MAENDEMSAANTSVAPSENVSATELDQPSPPVPVQTIVTNTPTIDIDGLAEVEIDSEPILDEPAAPDENGDEPQQEQPAVDVEQLQQDLQLYKNKWTQLSIENQELNSKLHGLEKNRLEFEDTIRQIKANLDDQFRNEIELYKKKWTDAAAEAHDLRTKLHILGKNRLEKDKSEAELYKKKWAELTIENQHLKTKVQGLEKKNIENEQALSKLNDTSNEQAQNEIELYKKKWSDLTIENHDLNVKLQNLEKNRLEHENTIRALKDNVGELQTEIDDYKSRLSMIDQLKVALESERELKANVEKEVERLKTSNTDMLAEMALIRQKEAELLEFTERATAKTVTLQSEHNTLEQRCAALQQTADKLQSQFDVLAAERDQAREELQAVQSEFEETKKTLSESNENRLVTIRDLERRMEEMENENRVMRKKHVNAIKELNRELAAVRRKTTDNLSDIQSLPAQSSGHDGMSMGSRTSSSTSLDVIQQPGNASAAAANHRANPSNGNGNGESNALANFQQQSHSPVPPQPPVPSAYSSSIKMNDLPELDKQMLVDRIIKLQKTLAKRSEKVDFLEEHNHQLIEEMKKKTRLIQHYIMREETGALSTNSMDENKRQMAKKGSTIMSSIYQPGQADAASQGTLTLELSLEINRKLQAVLEDTLLKNVMLKENINTLGEEIARMSNRKNSTASATTAANKASAKLNNHHGIDSN